MTAIFDGKDKLRTIELPDGTQVILLDRLGREDKYGKEECARNIYRVRNDGSIVWQVRGMYDACADPFASMEYNNVVLTGCRWDGGLYRIDINTGDATPILMR